MEVGETIGDVATTAYEEVVDFGETVYEDGLVVAYEDGFLVAYQDGLVVAYTAVEQEIVDGLPNVSAGGEWVLD